jgi:anthranilate synthase component 1
VNLHPGKAEFLELARQGDVIPVYTDLMADFETPVSVYAKLKGDGPAYLLESVEGGSRAARISIAIVSSAAGRA